MTGPNTGTGGPEVQKQKPDMPRQNMLELFDDVAEEKIFSFLHNEAELLQTLNNNPTKTYQEIREEMRKKLIHSPEGYENFTEEDIFNTGKISDKTIREKIENLLVHVRSGQDRLQAKTRSMFAPETFADTPDGNENRRRLDAWIPKQNAKDIEKYLKSPGLLRRKLGRECFGDDRINTFVSRDTFIGLEEMGIRVLDLSDPEKEAVKAIFGGAINSDKQHIQTYLKIIDRSPKDNTTKLRLKKNLIRTAFPTVSPKFLVDNGVITEAVGKERVRVGLQSILGADYFTTGSQEEKTEKQRYLDHVYTKSEHIEVPIDDYLNNDAFIESLFTKGKIGETEFTKRLEDVLTDMRTEVVAAEFDLDGMDIKPDLQGNWYESVVASLINLKDDKSPKVKNADKFGKGSYIRIVQNQNGKEKYSYIKILDVDKETDPSMLVETMRDKDGFPIKHRGIRFEDWTGDGNIDAMVTPGHERGGLEQPYVKLWTLLKDPNTTSEVLTEAEVQERRKIDYTGEDRIYTSASETDIYNSVDALTDVLGWTPKKGAVYTTQDVVGGADFYLEIVDIVDTAVDKKITVSDGKETHTISFQDFYNKIARPLKLKETGQYDSNDNINTLLQSIDGFKDITMKDGVLVQIVKGDDGKDIEMPVNHFMNDDGEGMYFSGITAGGVSAGFGKVKKGKNKGEDWSDIKGKTNLKAFIGNKTSLSIVGMLNMLRENDYKPYINPKDKPETDHEAHMPHSHGSFWGRIMNGTSVSDMMKGFDLYKHAWEHKLEKNSKFQSAKFADKYLRKFMPEGFSYQLRSEAYAAQNEAMEGILKMLENDMSGKEARLYIRKKILLNDDAKFEEVLAGLLYISKKSGQLYPEELSDLKNSNLWFYKLAVTQGHTSKASRQALREKCIKSSDKGAEDVNAITEIDLVERQLKYYEGKGYRIPPNAAPKFPGAIKEGEEESKKKGEMEINQRSNIKQMNKYALSKGYVGEWYKVLGTVDRLHTKNGTAAELNAMPFLMVYSNAPEYMGSNFRKALHSEGSGPRASHAFKFGNEMHLVNTYRSVVQMAAQEVSRRSGDSGILDELANIEKNRKKIGEESHDDEPDEFQKKWIISIYDFWMKHGKELQPILQMSDTFLMAKAKKGDPDAKKYQTRYNMLSGMQNGQVDKIYENANVHEGNMSRDHSPFHFTNLTNALFNDVYTQDGHLKHGDTTYAKIFKPGILGAFYELKKMKAGDLPEGIDLRETQYDQFEEYYAAIMYYMRQKANPPEKLIGGKKDQYSFQPQQYIMDLKNIGFNITREDFPISSDLTVGGVGQEQDGKYTETYLNDREKKRCRVMFNEFMRSTTNAMNTTRRSIHSAFDYDGWGG